MLLVRYQEQSKTEHEIKTTETSDKSYHSFYNIYMFLNVTFMAENVNRNKQLCLIILSLKRKLTVGCVPGSDCCC